MRILRDIAYGNHERHRVDVFIPEHITNDSGVIFFIHGGGWHSGDKSAHHHDCEHFCSLGYICATMNYRYVDENTSVYNELDDITNALKTVKDKCAKEGLNTEKVLLSGCSAGSHLALMYAYTRKDEAPLETVCACVYCPPVKMETTDFLSGISDEFEEWKNGLLSDCCGVRVNSQTLLCDEQQSALKRISPYYYVNENCVPTAVFHGVQDDLIPFSHIVEFVKLLDEKCVMNNFLIYENSGHTLDKDPEKVTQSKEIIKSYAEKYF